MGNLTRREFLKNLSLGLLLPRRLVQNPDVPQKNLEERLEKQYWEKEFGIDPRHLFSSFPAEAFGGIGALGGVDMYLDTDGNTYRGVAVLSLLKYAGFGKELRFFGSEGVIGRSGRFIPTATRMAGYNSNTFTKLIYSETHLTSRTIEYDYGDMSATLTKEGIKYEYNLFGLIRPPTPDKPGTFSVSLLDLLSRGKYVDDVVTGLFNMQVDKKEIIEKGSHTYFAVVPPLDKEEAKISPVEVKFNKEEYDNGREARLRNNPKKVYPLKSELRLFGKDEKYLIEGFVDQQFVPYEGTITTPLGILKVTRSILKPVFGLMGFK